MSLPPDSQTPPSTSALTLAACSLLLGALGGYFIGSGSSIGLFSPSLGNPSTRTRKTRQKSSWPNSYDVDVHVGSDTSDEEFIAATASGRGGADKDDEESDSDLDAEDEAGGELKSFANDTDEVKLMLVVRTDLGMTKGKIAAQAGHATLACYKALVADVRLKTLLRRWERGGQAKVAVQVKSEEELDELQARAMSLGLCARVIRDAGRTQIASGSKTVLGVVGPKGVVDNITGGLKLL